MTEAPSPAASPLPEIRQIALADLGHALRAGWADYRAAPRFGLFFAAVYVIGGLGLWKLGAGLFVWTLSMTLGFPLAAPFLAVGLYEVSRRLQRGEPLAFGDVLGVVWRERTRQVPWAGIVILLFFLFWSFFAHMLFALMMGPSALLGPPDDLASYLNSNGLTMIALELGFGAVIAFALFAVTVVSLPLLLDREVDFVSAMLLSFRAARANLPVMLVWAALIAGLTMLAMAPWFLGLFLVLPVLGHASWHLYTRVLE